MKNFPLFFIGGIIAGIISLIVSAILPVKAELVIVIIFVLIEEGIKISILWLILDFLKNNGLEIWLTLSLFVVFGLGFGAFELFLIFLNNGSLTKEMLSPAIIHILTSILLGTGAYLYLNKKKHFSCFLFPLLAIILHLCYNIGVLY